MEKVLEVKNIEKYYGNKSNLTKAIDNISFTIEKGEFVGIMGASGSGKTTLLNCISTIDRVTAGKIIINNQDITRLKGNNLNKFRREELGFIFQDFNLLDTLTAYENIALALTIQKVKPKEIKERVQEIAKKLGVSRSTYSLWELEINMIPLPRLVELCKIYSCSIDYILGLNKRLKKYPNMKYDINRNLCSKRLKEIRKEHKYTQDKIAKKLNTDNGVISRYESGKTLILTSFLMEYAKIFNISSDYLLGKIDEKIPIKELATV